MELDNLDQLVLINAAEKLYEQDPVEFLIWMEQRYLDFLRRWNNRRIDNEEDLVC